MTAIAEKEPTTRPCKDCGDPLYWTHRLGWVHKRPGIYLVCPSRDENKPVEKIA